jgi:hypothetical protein
VFGFILLCIVFHDVFEVMLLPRRVMRRYRLVRIFFNWSWGIWAAIAMRIKSVKDRENIIGIYGPLSLVLLMLIWAVILITSFGLVFYSLQAKSGFPRLMYMSGVTFFTLGYGDVTPQTPLSKALAVFEAGTGFGFIAIVISYLPVLYQMFSRREMHVIQLDARAGSPPSACTLLSRHLEGGGNRFLYQLLQRWEEWASEMVESHLSYPMLGYYRSQHHNQNWLVAMCAIMDTCALCLVGLRDVETFPAKMTFATARLALVELCRIFELSPKTTAEERLPPAEFEILFSELSKVGIKFSDPDEAENRLNEFRGTYEPFIMALSDYLLIPLPGWLPSDELDNWQNSPRGRTAKALVESTPANPE